MDLIHNLHPPTNYMMPFGLPNCDLPHWAHASSCAMSKQWMRCVKVPMDLKGGPFWIPWSEENWSLALPMCFENVSFFVWKIKTRLKDVKDVIVLFCCWGGELPKSLVFYPTLSTRCLKFLEISPTSHVESGALPTKKIEVTRWKNPSSFGVMNCFFPTKRLEALNFGVGPEPGQVESIYWSWIGWSLWKGYGEIGQRSSRKEKGMIRCFFVHFQSSRKCMASVLLNHL